MRNWQKQQVSSTPTSTEAISAEVATAGSDSDHLVAERRACCCCNSSDDAKLLDMVGMLSSVESSTGTAIRILNDLLNYDKIKSTGLRLDPEVFDPWDMMEAVTAGFQVQAREKGVCLRLAVEQRKSLRPTLVASSHNYSTVSSAAREDPQELMTSLVVNGDRLKLEQVARNLISNALKFTPTGRKITVTCKQIPLLSLSISISLSVS
jgi:signal transduction histidine kinase